MMENFKGIVAAESSAYYSLWVRIRRERYAAIYCDLTRVEDIRRYSRWWWINLEPSKRL
jgi:hypothetical protein